MNRASRAAIVALAGFGLAVPSLAVSAPAPAAPAHPSTAGPPATAAALKPDQWPQAVSDMKADPNILFGTLPNGMRYAIMHNDTPAGQVSMRLRINVGSLMETPQQQGLAHFLEHMAFNGSTNVPTRGEMVQDLERLGLAFGADTNASTGFDATTYKFDLPKSDPQTVDTSLMLLREIASNLTLTQKAMDEERGVILSEERLRDTPSFRIFKSQLAFTMEGQRPPERLPIGLVSVIKTADRDQLVDLYHKYYRPERATLVVVGDVDPAAMAAKIKARFGDWHGVGPAGTDPALGPVKPRKADFDLAVQAGAPTAFELAWVSPPDLSPDTLAKRRREIITQLGLAVLNRRLDTIARDSHPPFISAAASRGNELRAQRVTNLLVMAQPDRWKDALATAETEVRRIMQYGVRQDELAREVTEDEANLKLAVAGAATRRTPSLADDIASSLDDGNVVLSPAQGLALFEKVADGLTAQQVSAALKNAFQGDGPLVFMSSPEAVQGGVSAVRTAFDSAAAAPVTAPAPLRQVDWPYTTFGEPGKVVERRDIADLDTVFVRFDNGVRLTIKPTKFRQDEVLVRVRFGQGEEGESAKVQSMNWADSAFAEGGLSKISADDAERALAGQVYGVSVGAEPDAFTLDGATRTDNLPTQLQVLAAYMADPGWRPEGFQRLKTYGETLQAQLDATDTGVLSRDLQGLLHAGDPRWTFPSAKAMSAETDAGLKAELAPALASGPVEVDIVGDITVDKAIEDVARTFGSLPPRPAASPAPSPSTFPRFPAPTPTPIVETHDGRQDQGIAFVAWPTDGYFANLDQTRVEGILAQVLELRLIDLLRLKQGVTYSPAAGAAASTVFPHYGYIDAEMEAPPDKLDGFFADVDKIAADLKAAPISADELERAKKPAIDTLEKSMDTNAYWLNALGGAQTDPRRLTAIRSAVAGIERVSAADVQKAAQTYLRGAAAWKLEIRPKTMAVAQASR